MLGLARSGLAASAALERRGVEVVGADTKLGNDGDESLLDRVELLVKSPGVPGEAPLVGAARARGIPVWSELELGYRLLPENPLIAVTGTNGKTTTAEWLAFMLAAPVAGNVGRALTDLDGAVAPGEWIVVEVSSFQLEDVHEFHPRIAVLLNLEPDHLDRHGSFEAYRAAKLRVFENQTLQDVAVVPRDLDHDVRARRVEFSTQDELPAEPALRGAHNRENAAAAAAAARATEATDERIARGLREFPGVPHRLELVGEVAGVRYVNDSKATNVAAARRALAAYEEEPVHLILGGSRKHEDFAPLAASIGPNVKAVYVIGETADELGRAIPDVIQSRDLATAVARAAAAAHPGDVVLLSPACASYDQFLDFEQRGEEFRRLVQNLEA